MHVLEAPPELMAVHETDELKPSGKVLPEAGVQVLEVIGSAPLAVALYVTVAAGRLVLVWTFMFDGQIIVGGAALLTDTVNEHVEDLRARSTAVHATVVVPIGNMAPELTLHDLDETPDASVALNVNDTGVPEELTGATLREDGQLTVGATSS